MQVAPHRHGPEIDSHSQSSLMQIRQALNLPLQSLCTEPPGNQSGHTPPKHMIWPLRPQGRGLGVVWPPKRVRKEGLFSRSGGLFFFTFLIFCYFFVTFFTARNFYKLLFTAKTGVKFVTFFTVCNFHKLLFTVEKGQGLYFIHCARGKGCTLIFFLLFFYC